jgi:hypothetical protein
MANIVIENEGDLEFGITHCTELARMKGKKFMTLHFPSEFMFKLFLDNLYINFAKNNVPTDVDIDVQVIINDIDEDLNNEFSPSDW